MTGGEEDGMKMTEGRERAQKAEKAEKASGAAESGERTFWDFVVHDSEFFFFFFFFLIRKEIISYM